MQLDIVSYDEVLHHLTNAKGQQNTTCNKAYNVGLLSSSKQYNAPINDISHNCTSRNIGHYFQADNQMWNAQRRSLCLSQILTTPADSSIQIPATQPYQNNPSSMKSILQHNHSAEQFPYSQFEKSCVSPQIATMAQKFTQKETEEFMHEVSMSSSDCLHDCLYTDFQLSVLECRLRNEGDRENPISHIR